MTRYGAILTAFFALTACASTMPRTAAGDLRELAALVDAVHPAPYRFVARDVVSAIVEEEATRLDAIDAPDDLDVARSVHRTLACIGDGHLAVALPMFQPGAAHLSLLPLASIRIGDDVFVDASTLDLPAGTRLLAIDGEPIDRIWDRLAALALVDGSRPALQRVAIEHGLAQHYAIAYGMRDHYVLRLARPDGSESDVAVDGVERDPLAALRRISARDGTANDGWPTLTHLDGRAVLLRASTFAIEDTEAYARRVDAIFAGLDGTETLVIDLRGNRGGLRTNGIAILDHVIDHPYTEWLRMAVRVRAMPSAFRARVTFPFVPESGLLDRFADARAEGELFVVDGDPLAGWMAPHAPSHRGPVVVFVDGTTASAATETIAALRAARPDVRLVGEETQGGCADHVGEVPIAFTTSHFTVMMSLVAITQVATDGCVPGRGFVPDVSVTYTREDFLARRDPYLAAL